MANKRRDIEIGIVICGIIFLIICFALAKHGSDFCWLSFILFILSVIAFFYTGLTNKIIEYPEETNARIAYQEKISQQHQKRKQEYDLKRREFIDAHGELSKELVFINYSNFNINSSTAGKIFVSQNSDKILILNEIYGFNDILSFSLKDDEKVVYQNSVSTSKSSTSTSSMVGRALVGGILLGGVGAIIGGATAKKVITTVDTPQQATVYHNYKLQIIVNRISEPQIDLNLGGNIDMVNELVSILSVIIERNKKTK